MNFPGASLHSGPSSLFLRIHKLYWFAPATRFVGVLPVSSTHGYSLQRQLCERVRLLGSVPYGHIAGVGDAWLCKKEASGQSYVVNAYTELCSASDSSGFCESNLQPPEIPSYSFIIHTPVAPISIIPTPHIPLLPLLHPVVILILIHTPPSPRPHFNIIPHIPPVTRAGFACWVAQG